MIILEDAYLLKDYYEIKEQLQMRKIDYLDFHLIEDNSDKLQYYFRSNEIKPKLGFNITVIENPQIKDGNPIMYMSPTDYKNYTDKLKKP